MTEALFMSYGKHILGMPKGKHIFGTVKVGEKGQIVIPKEAREKYGIKAGDTLLVLGDDAQGLIVTTPDVIKSVALEILGDSKDTED